MGPLQMQMLQHPGFPIGLSGCGAKHRHYFRIAPIMPSRGVKCHMINLGAKLCARLRAWCKRALASVFFFPLMWKMHRLMLLWIWIFIAAIRIGLCRLRAWRELKMLKDVVESVWMATQ